MLTADAEQSLAQGDYAVARERFIGVQKMLESRDPYVLRRLALATYKAEQPTRVAALREALAILAPLEPAHSNDPETLELATDIELALFEALRDSEHLERSLRFCERGHSLRRDPTSGIQLAYLLTVRAAGAQDAMEKMTDTVSANRIRKEVLKLCEEALGQGVHAEKDDHAMHRHLAQIWAAKAEALFGLGEVGKFQEACAVVGKLAPAALEPLEARLSRLEGLMALSTVKF